MFRIKRLYLYILQTFVPVFFMTFVICLFIILMQFVWKYVEDLVGKGLEPMVVAELFAYAAINLAPTALPLAILLASLMAFGNLGEKYELLAIKSSGISLLKAMRPLIILVGFISIGAYYFQDDIIPKVQVKFRTLMISIRQKSPELDIPENTFYSGIDNYNLFVKSKNKETGMMYNLMIYDVSKGFDNMAVIVCDSGKIKISSNKDYLLLNLHNGQQFSNFQQGGTMMRQNASGNNFVPYMRENFKERRLIMPFDANFNRMDESSMDGTQISKNTAQLRHSIDSLSNKIDSMNVFDRDLMISSVYFSYKNINQREDAPKVVAATDQQVYDLDSIVESFSLQEKTSIYNEAIAKAEMNRNDVTFRSLEKIDTRTRLRQHDVEFQGKFSLSFACLVFFFIGAPLGAIIRKGGLGMPVVVSVAMFIFYYIINNLGYKFARDGVWDVWQGVWLSSFVLFPLGAFITYKAINDSALFNPEAYGKYFRKILLIQRPAKISESKREAMVDSIPSVSDLSLNASVVKSLEGADSDDLRAILEIGKSGAEEQLVALSILKNRGADINSFIDQQDKQYSRDNLGFFMKSLLLTLSAYVLFIVSYFLDFANLIVGFCYLILFVRSTVYYFNFYGKVNKKKQFYNFLMLGLSFFLLPFTFYFLKKQMDKHINRIQILS